MEAKIIDKLTSGKLKIQEYSNEEIKSKTRIKSVLMDINNNLPDFELNVVVITKVIPFEGYSVSDVLLEYLKKNGSKKLFISQAGTLDQMPEAASIGDGTAYLKKERDELMKAKFYNTIFNRVMSLSYGNPDIFMYGGSRIGKKFIQDNLGEDKIITRTISK